VPDGPAVGPAGGVKQAAALAPRQPARTGRGSRRVRIVASRRSPSIIRNSPVRNHLLASNRHARSICDRSGTRKYCPVSDITVILASPQSSAVTGVELPNVGWAVQCHSAPCFLVALRNYESTQAWAVNLRTLSWTARPRKWPWTVLMQAWRLRPRQSVSSARRQAILSLTLLPAEPPVARTVSATLEA
jgi:hypothetical protein